REGNGVAVRAGIRPAINDQRAADACTHTDVKKRRLFAAGAETGLCQGGCSHVRRDRDAAMIAKAGAHAVGTPIQGTAALDLPGLTHQRRYPYATSAGAQALRSARTDPPPSQRRAPVEGMTPASRSFGADRTDTANGTGPGAEQASANIRAAYVDAQDA